MQSTKQEKPFPIQIISKTIKQAIKTVMKKEKLAKKVSSPEKNSSISLLATYLQHIESREP